MRTMLLLILMLVNVGCADTTAKQCPTGQVRGWCQFDISTTTLACLAAGVEPVTTQATITACVPDAGSSPAAAIINRATRWMKVNYYSGSNSFYPYVVRDDKVLSAKFARDAVGNVKCDASDKDINPYGGSYLDVDKGLNAIAPKYHPQDNGEGGSSAASDCDACLVAAACDMASLATCAHDHCGAVCPMGGTCSAMPPRDNCAAAGDTCSVALCCAGLTCFASDVGSVCQ